MSTSRDLVGVALSGLAARKMRTVLLLLGPMIGVAAIIAAVGLTDSAKGDLKAKVDELGTNLVEVSASSSFGQQSPTLPVDDIDRALTVTTVESVASVRQLSNVLVTPYTEAREEFATVPIPVLAADASLPDVLEVDLVAGRWLDSFDEAAGARVAVIGQSLAREFSYLPGENRTIELDGFSYAVVGVLERIQLEPGFDNAVFIPFQTTADDFFDGMFATALEEGEIIVSVDFPIPEKSAYAKFLQPASRFALTGAFVAKYADGVRVAITGASENGVFRWTEAEQALSSNFSADAIRGLSVGASGMIGDIHGTPEYRAHLVGVMTRRAVEAAA